MSLLCLDFKSRWAELERKIGAKVKESVKGFLILKKAGLDDDLLQDVVLALNRDWKFQSVEKKLRQFYENKVLPKFAQSRSHRYRRHQARERKTTSHGKRFHFGNTCY